MNTSTSKNLLDRTQSIDFYDDRYAHGYMDDWPVDKKQRVFELIRNLDLPLTGNALEFGCGNGVFTEVIRQALPQWQVYGSDISSVAIQTAQKRYPQCTFFVAGDSSFQDKKFDFLLTHHVLEHVYNIKEITGDMAQLVEDKGSMLHILPCGNKNSFEYNLCQLRKDGINPSVGNRFFFEDEGHVRRLDTQQLSALVTTYGFRLHQEYYSNQYYGALKWITEYDTAFVRQLTNPTSATNLMSAGKLALLRLKLLTLKQARSWAHRRLPEGFRLNTVSRIVKYPMYAILKKVSSLVEAYYVQKADQEWQQKSVNQNGSEMYLYFIRE